MSESVDVLTLMDEPIPDWPEEQLLQARAAVQRMLEATPVKGGNRVAILRELGWVNRGVCYKRDKQLTIAAYCAAGRADEMWEKMPRRGRPKLSSDGDVAGENEKETVSV